MEMDSNVAELVMQEKKIIQLTCPLRLRAVAVKSMLEGIYKFDFKR